MTPENTASVLLASASISVVAFLMWTAKEGFDLYERKLQSRNKRHRAGEAIRSGD